MNTQQCRLRSTCTKNQFYAVTCPSVCTCMFRVLSRCLQSAYCIFSCKGCNILVSESQQQSTRLLQSSRIAHFCTTLYIMRVNNGNFRGSIKFQNTFPESWQALGSVSSAVQSADFAVDKSVFSDVKLRFRHV